MKVFKVILALVVEFILLYLMFAFGQWNMNAYYWGSELRGMFSGLFLMFGFFIIMFYLMVSCGDIDDD